MNIYEIADLAGVSISTVSRVMNNQPNVRPETREKVQKVLEETNYMPSHFARGLVTKTSKMVGIMTIDMRIPHYASTIYALESELHANGYRAIICNTGGDIEKGNDYLRMLFECGASGAILIGSVFHNKFFQTSLMETNGDFFYLLINYRMELSNSCSVMLDDNYGVRIVLDYLMSKGHRNIVYVQDAETQSGILKKDCFLDGIAANKLDQSGQRVFVTKRSLEGGKRAFDDILSSGVDPTAVFVGDDLTAMGLIYRAQELGKRIPEDLAVVGYNNSQYGTICRPSITTVDTKNDIVSACVVLLMKKIISGQQTSPIINVQPELVIREST